MRLDCVLETQLAGVSGGGVGAEKGIAGSDDRVIGGKGWAHGVWKLTKEW
jgi:hypothetical protein